MGETVKPKMAELLGLERFDPKNPKPDTFSCSNEPLFTWVPLVKDADKTARAGPRHRDRTIGGSRPAGAGRGSVAAAEEEDVSSLRARAATPVFG